MSALTAYVDSKLSYTPTATATASTPSAAALYPDLTCCSLAPRSSPLRRSATLYRCTSSLNPHRESPSNHPRRPHHRRPSFLSSCSHPALTRVLSPPPTSPTSHNDTHDQQGELKGFDQTTNVILSHSSERVYSMDEGVEEVELGLYVVRGDNIVRQQFSSHSLHAFFCFLADPPSASHLVPSSRRPSSPNPPPSTPTDPNRRTRPRSRRSSRPLNNPSRPNSGDHPLDLLGRAGYSAAGRRAWREEWGG